MKLKKIDPFLVGALFIYCAVLFPFANVIPLLDGNIDFVQSLHFYSGGISEYVKNWGSVHPPLKIILVSIFFSIFGLSPFFYTTLGILSGIVGITAFYFLARTLFGTMSGRIAALLLATSPLFIATSLFVLRDQLLMVLIVCSVAFYAYKKIALFTLCSSLAVLTKEPAILFPICVIATEIVFSRKINKNVLASTIPLGVFALWSGLLKAYGAKSWNDWIFTETASQGTPYTILNNLISGKVINEYAQQHLLQLFVLNFNWILWLFLISGCLYVFISKTTRQVLLERTKTKNIAIKTAIITILFSLTFALTVLTLQTFTIPRYHLPIIPFLLLGISFLFGFFYTHNMRIFSCAVVILPIFLFLHLFTSVDPLSNALWGRTTILGENVYSLHQNKSGNDGITYNAQYLFVAKKRDYFIKNNIFTTDAWTCYWILPDARNDRQTLEVLNYSPESIPCKF